MTGTLYGIGVGPGDPELLTLKGHRLIGECNVIAYPAPDDGPSFARSIVAEYLDASMTEIVIEIPMRASRFPAKDVYDKAAQDIAAHLNNGEDVAVLCEGDPFFYGSFMYLFERLGDDYNTQIVPGVSSLMASACTLQRPLAARNDVLSVIPAPLDAEIISEKLSRNDAIAIIKIGRHFDKIRKLIDAAGLTAQAGYLERISLENQKVMPLAEVEQDAAPYFSMILIYRGSEDWMRTLTLAHSTSQNREPSAKEMANG